MATIWQFFYGISNEVLHILLCHFLSFKGDQNNPFLQEQYAYDAAGAQIPAQQGGYYGGGYTQAQSGYSSSGYGKFWDIKFVSSIDFIILVLIIKHLITPNFFITGLQ